MSEPWLTKREVALALRTSVRTIERLRPPCVRVGGQNRYLRSEVEDFLQGASRPAAEVVPFPGNRRKGSAA